LEDRTARGVTGKAVHLTGKDMVNESIDMATVKTFRQLSNEVIEDSILAEGRAYLPSSLVTSVENILRGIEDDVGIDIRSEPVRDFL
tara:strand:- start:84 stop:344 length:261 start_codon:yes stop_codon:yes gene_type:complete